ncbi:MAG: precorrin-8X methylmutase [Planctomycetota bacterium]|jgi:precorrin-8X/cobalt-precorrin-8 methylmutase|nr:precorrin-8X methylmutase [Planctomycetota bacterium]
MSGDPGENLGPEEIERRSLEAVSDGLEGFSLPAGLESVIKRVIHATADFDYAESIRGSPGAAAAGIAALRSGVPLVVDTRMVQAGINRAACRALGCETHCLIDDPEIAAAAGGRTRAGLAMEKAARLWRDGIYVVGNAPTALMRICELISEAKLSPRLVVGVPVGFVQVLESKEMLLASRAAHIVAKGRKGGSSVAAAILNALLKEALAG